MEKLNLREKLIAYGVTAIFGSAILFNFNQVYSTLSVIFANKKQENSVKIINYDNKNYSGEKVKWINYVLYNFAHPPNTSEVPFISDSSDYYTSSFGKEEYGEEGFTLDKYEKYKNNMLEYIVNDTTHPEFNSRQYILRQLIKSYNRN